MPFIFAVRFGHEGQRGGRRGAAASSLTHEIARFISCFEHRVACVAFGILRVAYFCDRRGVRYVRPARVHSLAAESRRIECAIYFDEFDAPPRQVHLLVWWSERC